MISLKQLNIEFSPFEKFKKFFEPLPGLLKFVSLLMVAAIPMIVYILYPYFYGRYEYVSNVFFLWISAGLFSLMLTYLILHISASENEAGPTFFFRNFLLLVFWFFTIFSSVTDSAYRNGHQLAIEQTGHCELVDENEQRVCAERQKELGEKSGVFSVMSGELLGDGSCYMKLSETLSSGFIRKVNLFASSNFCKEVKVGNSVRLISKLQKYGDFCDGNKKIYTTEDSGGMDIQVCTSYSLIAK